jgi:DNA-binding XRE family transcriptional regulator
MLGSASGSYYMRMNAETAAPQSKFASFLKTRRQSIPPDSMTLGSWERLPVRRGRRVTQEEIAEAVGISRNWYRRLESGDAPRASAKLLDRIAKAFQFTPEERTNLFVLGIPEIAQTSAT